MPRCKECGCAHCPVINTREYTVRCRLTGKKKEVTRRRRACRYCGHVFWTTEDYEESGTDSNGRSQKGIPEKGFTEPPPEPQSPHGKKLSEVLPPNPYLPG